MNDDGLTAEERAHVRAVLAALPPQRLEKVPPCLDELGPPERIREVIRGLSANADAAGRLHAVARFVDWVAQGVGYFRDVKLWIAGGAGLFWWFQDPIRQAFLLWLNGGE